LWTPGSASSSTPSWPATPTCSTVSPSTPTHPSSCARRPVGWRTPVTQATRQIVSDPPTPDPTAEGDMTSLLEGARSMVARGSDLGERLAALESATDAARGRLDDDVVDAAHEVAERAAGRLRLSADHTIVAIAGATGS